MSFFIERFSLWCQMSLQLLGNRSMTFKDLSYFLWQPWFLYAFSLYWYQTQLYVICLITSRFSCTVDFPWPCLCGIVTCKPLCVVSVPFSNTYYFTWHRLPLYKVLLNSVSIVDTASPISVLITSLLKYILTVHALLSYSIDILIRIYCHYLVLWIWNEPLGFNWVRMSMVVQSRGSTDGESKGRQQWDFPETIWIF